MLCKAASAVAGLCPRGGFHTLHMGPHVPTTCAASLARLMSAAETRACCARLPVLVGAVFSCPEVIRQALSTWISTVVAPELACARCERGCHCCGRQCCTWNALATVTVPLLLTAADGSCSGRLMLMAAAASRCPCAGPQGSPSVPKGTGPCREQTLTGIKGPQGIHGHSRLSVNGVRGKHGSKDFR